jgi:Family of unknown function (DUF6152)
MRATLGVFVTLAATLLVFSVSTFAHHGNAAYDAGTSLTVKGTVTDFRFINPHCQVYFDIKNSKGEVEHWQAELTAPNKLSRAGWTKHSLSPGDEITVTGFQGKNGGHSIWIRKLVGPDGQPMQLSED